MDSFAGYKDRGQFILHNFSARGVIGHIPVSSKKIAYIIL